MWPDDQKEMNSSLFGFKEQKNRRSGSHTLKSDFIVLVEKQKQLTHKNTVEKKKPKNEV